MISTVRTGNMGRSMRRLNSSISGKGVSTNGAIREVRPSIPKVIFRTTISQTFSTPCSAVALDRDPAALPAGVANTRELIITRN
jgi:hypothetical protein